MSIRNLIPYLKLKNNEIVDCFVEDGMISLLRLFYLPSNSFFILDITSQQIPLDSSFAEQVQVSVITKLKEFEEDYSEELIHMYQVLQSEFTKSIKYFILFFGEYIMIDSDNIFKIQSNFISSAHHHPYSYFSLEWFYDNHSRLEAMIRPLQNDFFLKVHQHLNIFLNIFSNNNTYFLLLKNHYNEIEEKRKLYEIILKLSHEVNTHHVMLAKDLKKQDDYSKVFSIAESENRLFRKKKIRDQIAELLPLKKQTRETLLDYRNDLFYHELLFLYYITRIKNHLSTLQSIQFKYETKMQH